MYVELKHINKTYDNYKASDDINIQIEKGKLVGLLGPSGSGKTTILRMIAGLEAQDSGDIIIDGKVVNDTPAGKRGIGFVFQNYALFRYMTVEENIGFGLEVRKVSKKEIKDRVNELLDLIGLTGLNDRYPSQLSGGQQQRVAFARALAPYPHLLLLDEPFAAIDAKVRKELRSWLKSTISQLGITSIFVTHDQDEAVEVADEIIVTNKGRIEQAGDPLRIYQYPETAFIASFMGENTIIKEYQRYKTFDVIEGADQAIVRPEFIKLTGKSDDEKYKISATPGIVERIVFHGTHMEVHVRIGEDMIIVRRGLEKPPLHIGDWVSIFLYRIFVTKGNQVYQLENKAIREVVRVI